jgi:16S rRNA (cytidine1402-2'-O)-methyltransferase
MRSNSPTTKTTAGDKGTLYVLATPIGNRGDITLRALDVLSAVDVIAAEDTRHTARLLKGHRFRGRLISYHEHNEERRAPLLLEKLEAGCSVAVVSNAGTPSISDPGYRLVEGAVARAITVSPVPGASAAIAALSVSGLPTDAFVFIGFPPRKKGRRSALLHSLRGAPWTMIFFESPKRIIRLLRDLLGALGDRRAVLGREMTKLHEEFLRGRLSELTALLQLRPEVKGECTLVVSGHPLQKAAAVEGLYEMLAPRLRLHKDPVSEVVKEVTRKTGLPRRVVYGKALEIKYQLEQEDTPNGSA